MKNKWFWSFLAGLGFIFFQGCQSPYAQGKALYLTSCANCHMDDGSGLEGIIPPLQGSDLIWQQPDLLPCIVRNGMEGPARVNGVDYNQVMAPVFGLNDVELANVLNYLQFEWGDRNIFYSPDRIRENIGACGEGPVNMKSTGDE